MSEIPKPDTARTDNLISRNIDDIADAIFGDDDEPKSPLKSGGAPAGNDASARPDNSGRSNGVVGKVSAASEDLSRLAKSLLEVVGFRRNTMSGTERAAFEAEVNRIYDGARAQITGQDVSEEHLRILAAAKEQLLAEKEKLGQRSSRTRGERKASASEKGRGKENKTPFDERLVQGEEWIHTTESVIPTIANLDDLQKMTRVVGQGTRARRSVVFPDELKPLLRKNTPSKIKNAFGSALDDLMELWRKRAVDVYFAQPDVQAEFVKFLGESSPTLQRRRLGRASFFSQYLRKPGILDGLEDLKGCDVLKDKLNEIFDKHFPNIGAAQQKIEPKKGELRGVELSEAETEERRKRWLEEIKKQILASGSVPALKSLTHIKSVGGSRRINLPLDFRLYRKDTPPEKVQAIQGELSGLLDLWRERVADVLFASSAVEELFIDRLGAMYERLADKRTTQEDFYEEFLGSRKFDFTDIGDVKKCAAMKKKLGGLWDMYYPATETAVNESKYAILIAAFKKKEKPLEKGRDGKEFTVLEVSDIEQLLRVNYDGLVRKLQPKNIDVVFKYLQEQHRWSPEWELVSASKEREPEKRAGQELNMLQIIVDARKKHVLDLLSKKMISENQCGYFVRHLGMLIQMAKLAIDDEEYNKVPRIINLASKAIVFPEKLIPRAQAIGEKPVAVGFAEENKRERRLVRTLAKQEQKWVYPDKQDTQAKFDDVVKELQDEGFMDASGFVVGTYLKSLFEKYPPATDEEREKLTKLANVFQDGISKVYIEKRNKFYPLAGKDADAKERSYEELEKALKTIKKKQCSSVVAEGLAPLVRYAEAKSLSLKSIIEQLSVEKVIQKMAPSLLKLLPPEWNDKERSLFASRFAQKEIEESLE